MALDALKGWSARQKHVVAASYLGWTLDAFDFFVLVFVLPDVAAQFGVRLPTVALAVTLTLAVRPLGAFLFGRLADDYGRRRVLMLNIALYSVFGFATAFAPSLTLFLIIRALFGVAMGGVWGIGASLAMETVPAKARGFVSGLLQSGYPSGYLVASLAFGALYVSFGWRGMFMAGLVPGLALAAYIYAMVPESPGWARPARVHPGRHGLHLLAVAAALAVMMTLLIRFGRDQGLLYVVAITLPLLAVGAALTPFIRRHWKTALYAVLLMTCFNFFSHGTQDLYPTFLREQHHFAPGLVTTITVILNLGAILGGIVIGSLSQSWGRRRTMIAAALCALPVAWLWAYSEGAAMLAVGAFLMQVCVQGAWGVVPAHLNELSPADARGTFPGTVYQLGNLLASVNAVLQAGWAEQAGGDYRLALAGVAVCAAIGIALVVGLGHRTQDIEIAPAAGA
jgi:SHS family lactate transporter-like MFS transporter